MDSGAETTKKLSTIVMPHFLEMGFSNNRPIAVIRPMRLAVVLFLSISAGICITTPSLASTSFFDDNDELHVTDEYIPGEFQPIYDAMVNICEEAMPTEHDRLKVIKDIVSLLRLSDLAEGDIPNLHSDVDIPVFLKQTAHCANQNIFLRGFIPQALHHSPPFFAAKKDAHVVIPKAVMYMAILDRITRRVREQPYVLWVIQERFNNATADGEWKQYFNRFERAKKWTIDLGVDALALASQTGYVDPARGRVTMPLNIVEACLEDYRLGYAPNARCGLAIAFETPGSKEYNPDTGEGPTVMTDDMRGVLYRLPLPEKWTDVYQAWDMAFVAHYDNAPMFWAKLFYPHLACYHQEPEGYVYTRAVSLYVHLHYEVFRRVKAGSASPDMKWGDGVLTELWGLYNEKQVTSYYEEPLVEARSRSEGWLEWATRKMMKAFTSSTGETLTQWSAFMEDLERYYDRQGDDLDNMDYTTLYKLALKAGAGVSSIIETMKDLF